MNDSIYRYRPMSRLIGDSQELEKQQFVMSTPSHLNDPMEGFYDIVWKGDRILWESLLRHYVLNLVWATSVCAIWDDDSFDEAAFAPLLSRTKLPTDVYRSLVDHVCAEFLNTSSFAQVIPVLADLPMPLRRGGLASVLSLIHRPVLTAVVRAFKAKGMVPNEWPTFEAHIDAGAVVNAIGHISAAMQAGEWERDDAGAIGSVLHHVSLHKFLAEVRGSEDMALDLGHRKFVLLAFEFPQRYVAEISSSLIHTNWHTLCFSKRCDNPTMWAAYADDHRGAALMVRYEPGQGRSFGTLPVRGRKGWRGGEPIEGVIRAPLYEVDYESRQPEIEFFRFLATLPRPQILADWYTNPAGEQSPLAEEVMPDQDTWRDQLWDLFHQSTTRKLPEWRHEAEVRMVLPDLFNSDGSHRELTYEFGHLSGIVFGLRTPIEARAKAIRILEKKRGETKGNDFGYYQMILDDRGFRPVRIA